MEHFVSGNRGFSEWTLRATTAEGEDIEVRGCDIWTFADDLIGAEELVLEESSDEAGHVRRAGRVGTLEGDEIAVLDVADDARLLRAGRRRGDRRAGRARGDTPARADRPEEVLPHRRQLPGARGGVEAGRLVARDRPWIVFFQNVDAIVGPDEPVVYPEHLTEELDYELELAVVVSKPGSGSRPRRRPTTSAAT